MNWCQKFNSLLDSAYKSDYLNSDMITIHEIEPILHNSTKFIIERNNSATDAIRCNFMTAFENILYINSTLSPFFERFKSKSFVVNYVLPMISDAAISDRSNKLRVLYFRTLLKVYHADDDVLSSLGDCLIKSCESSPTELLDIFDSLPCSFLQKHLSPLINRSIDAFLIPGKNQARSYLNAEDIYDGEIRRLSHDYSPKLDSINVLIRSTLKKYPYSILNRYFKLVANADDEITSKCRLDRLRLMNMREKNFLFASLNLLHDVTYTKDMRNDKRVLVEVYLNKRRYNKTEIWPIDLTKFDYLSVLPKNFVQNVLICRHEQIVINALAFVCRAHIKTTCPTMFPRARDLIKIAITFLIHEPKITDSSSYRKLVNLCLSPYLHKCAEIIGKRSSKSLTTDWRSVQCEQIILWFIDFACLNLSGGGQPLGTHSSITNVKMEEANEDPNINQSYSRDAILFDILAIICEFKEPLDFSRYINVHRHVFFGFLTGSSYEELKKMAVLILRYISSSFDRTFDHDSQSSLRNISNEDTDSEIKIHDVNKCDENGDHDENLEELKHIPTGTNASYISYDWNKWYTLTDSQWPKDTLSSVYLLKYYLTLSDKSYYGALCMIQSFEKFINENFNDWGRMWSRNLGIDLMERNLFVRLTIFHKICSVIITPKVAEIIGHKIIKPSVYGLFQNIRYLLMELPHAYIEIFNNSVFKKNAVEFYAHMVSTFISFAQFVFPFVKDPAPEGYISTNQDFIGLNEICIADLSLNDLNNEANTVIKPEAFAMYCWRSLRETSLIFGELVSTWTSDPTLYKEILKDEDIRLEYQNLLLGIHDYYKTLLLESLHMGSIEFAYTGFNIVCDAIFKFDSNKCVSLDRKKCNKLVSSTTHPIAIFRNEKKVTLDLCQIWLSKLMISLDIYPTTNFNPSNIDKNTVPICLTRRGAGLPFYLLALLSHHKENYIDTDNFCDDLKKFDTNSAIISEIYEQNSEDGCKPRGSSDKEGVNGLESCSTKDGFDFSHGLFSLLMNTLILWADPIADELKCITSEFAYHITALGKNIPFPKKVLALNMLRAIFRDSAAITPKNMTNRADKLLYTYAPIVIMKVIYPLFSSPHWPLKNLANLCFVPIGKRIFGNHFGSARAIKTDLNDKKKYYRNMDYREFWLRYKSLAQFIIVKFSNLVKYLVIHNQNGHMPLTRKSPSFSSTYPLLVILLHLSCPSSNPPQDGISYETPQNYFNNFFPLAEYAPNLVYDLITFCLLCNDTRLSRLTQRLIMNHLKLDNSQKYKKQESVVKAFVASLLQIYTAHSTQKSIKTMSTLELLVSFLKFVNPDANGAIIPQLLTELYTALASDVSNNSPRNKNNYLNTMDALLFNLKFEMHRIFSQFSHPFDDSWLKIPQARPAFFAYISQPCRLFFIKSFPFDPTKFISHDISCEYHSFIFMGAIDFCIDEICRRFPQYKPLLPYLPEFKDICKPDFTHTSVLTSFSEVALYNEIDKVGKIYDLESIHPIITEAFNFINNTLIGSSIMEPGNNHYGEICLSMASLLLFVIPSINLYGLLNCNDLLQVTERIVLIMSETRLNNFLASPMSNKIIIIEGDISETDIDNSEDNFNHLIDNIDIDSPINALHIELDNVHEGPSFPNLSIPALLMAGKISNRKIGRPSNENPKIQKGSKLSQIITDVRYDNLEHWPEVSKTQRCKLCVIAKDYV
ncbi:uncharacterized protein LOC135928616 [Gordionus sp. m RMFG-2023]|uniref:uncharacterized protein LOC135928616 n=1 Tax=Gordionus sp. m RMFG-2023 TaxID=3053472 RepID=UPI0031FE1153